MMGQPSWVRSWGHCSGAVSLVVLASAVCACAGGGGASPTRPAPGAATAATSPAAAGRCGEDANFTLAGASPVGRSYRNGDQLAITVRYSLPGCKGMAAVFRGSFAAGSPRARQACRPACMGPVAGQYQSARVVLATSAGTATFSAGGATNGDVLAPPSIEGFTLCSVELDADDGVFGGLFYRQNVGSAC